MGRKHNEFVDICLECNEPVFEGECCLGETRPDREHLYCAECGKEIKAPDHGWFEMQRLDGKLCGARIVHHAKFSPLGTCYYECPVADHHLNQVISRDDWWSVLNLDKWASAEEAVDTVVLLGRARLWYEAGLGEKWDRNGMSR